MYYTIHSFMAQVNQRLATEVSGSDRVRYLREYLYHCASNEGSPNLPQLLTQVVQQITEEPLEFFSQFYEEFLKDEELREVLGSHITLVFSLLHRHWSQANWQLATELSGAERIHFLQESFSHMLQDTEVPDLATELAQRIERVIQEEAPEDAFRLYEALARDDKFRATLGENFDTFASRIRENFEAEGQA